VGHGKKRAKEPNSGKHANTYNLSKKQDPREDKEQDVVYNIKRASKAVAVW
jgi:hypothetical protein